MPTLEELFRSKKLESQGGQTAAEAYDIRNSKKIRISSSNPLVNVTGMLLARGARNAGIRKSESFLEEELMGLRIIGAGSTPFIYGSDSARITLRTTPLLDTMKSGANGEMGDGGTIGTKIAEARDFVNDKLGIPSNIIPTKVIGDVRISQKGITQNRMIDLAEIRKSGEGSLLGKFLKDGGGGSLQTIGKQAIGAAINLAKDKIRGKLFGARSTTGFNTADPSKNGSNISINYGSIDNASGITIKKDPNTGNIDVQGLMYSKTFDLTIQDAEPGKVNFIGGNDLEGGLAVKTPDLVIDRTLFSSVPSRVPKFLEASKGIYTTKDTINAQGVFSGASYLDYDDKDFAALKFTSVVQGKTVQFRATISGLNETLSPSWDSGKFVGSPFSYYTYSGIERSVSFNFKVFSLNKDEHKVAWDKINFLTGLVYPQGYYNSSAVKPPFIRFTLGDLYKSKYGFIESLTHTFDDGTPWDVDQKGYRLPMIVDVAVTIKFVENRGQTSDKKFYTFTPQTS